MIMTTFNKYIDEYIDIVESGKVVTNNDVKKAINLVKEKLSQSNVVIKSDMIEKAIQKIEEYFPFKLLPWEKFIIALIHCYYDDDTLVWDTFFILCGRGAGKNGLISGISWYLTTNFHGIKEYNVDIVANSESQAKVSFDDVYNVIEDNKRLQKAFYHTKEKIVYKKNRSYLKFNTSNARTKDGLRSACVIFDEIHEYEDYSNIKVFRSALGKKKNCRTFMISTNGNVRGGVLDDYLELSQDILNGENKTSKMFPLLYHLDSPEEVEDKMLWEKANPSLRFFKELQIQMEQEYEDMQSNEQLRIEFMTKRMNCPQQDTYTAVASWEKIKATNKPLPELKGLSCIGGVDYASVRDFVSCGLLFKVNVDGRLKRIFFQHSFVCHKSLEIKGRKIKFDIETAIKKGLCTIVKEDSIDPAYVVNWFLEKTKLYNIIDIKCDDYRKIILQDEFSKVGLPLSSVRSGYITHNKLYPLVEKLFDDEDLIFGDDMMMRWYTNNVYVETDKKENKSFKKIEPKLRKTDGFFAFLHSLSGDEKLKVYRPLKIYDCHSY